MYLIFLLILTTVCNQDTKKLSSDMDKSDINRLNMDRLCSSVTYGKYCSIGHTSIYGEKPVDKLDEICHKHDVCTAIGLTDRWCNCQLAYYSMNIAQPEQEIMRQCMIYYGALACGVSTFYSSGYDSDILIPMVDKWNYYTIFSDNDNTYTISSNETLYYCILEHYDTYLFYTTWLLTDRLVFKRMSTAFKDAVVLRVRNESMLIISNYNTKNLKVNVITRSNEMANLNDTLHKKLSELQLCNDHEHKSQMNIATLETKLSLCSTYGDKMSGIMTGLIVSCVVFLLMLVTIVVCTICTICCIVIRKKR
jgi:hypothetical protein